MSTSERYEIRVQGHLGSGLAGWFEGLSIWHDDNAQTVLTGPSLDQAALPAVLHTMLDLNLKLISVRLIGRELAGSEIT